MVSVDAECESVHMHIYIILGEISFHLFVLHTLCKRLSSQSAALLCLKSECLARF